jgi:CRISPR/Cas system-associated exonuclease Cas4 (RecB family)
MIQNISFNGFVISPSVVKGYIFCPYNSYLKASNIKKTNSSINSKGISSIYHYLFYSVFAEFIEDKWVLFDYPNVENSFNEFNKFINSKKVNLGKENIDYYILSKNSDEIKNFLNKLKEKVPIINDRFNVVEIEKKLEIKLKNNITLLGFIDIVMLDKKTNKLVIFDLKNTDKATSNSSIMSLQFYFYSSMLKKLNSLDYYPTFYELNFKNFSASFRKFNENSPERKILNKTINEILKSIKTNNFPKKIGSNCLECNYSIVCRGLKNVRN